MTARIGFKPRQPALVVAGLFFAVLATSGQQSRATDVDRKEISAILARWQDAWNQHDMQAFAAQFQEDAVWVLWTGDVWKGREAIERGHAAVHKTVFRNSKKAANSG